jgi:hypothetical protein
MATTDPVEIKEFRDALAAANVTLEDALLAFEIARAELREAKRTEDDVSAFQTAYDDALAAFDTARNDEATAFAELQSAIEAWLPAGTQGDPAAAATEIARFEAKVPIVLVPVRVETRFDADFLKIRISPDEISLNTHELPLTREEDEAGRAYWEAYIAGTEERVLWRDIIKRFDLPRAAYVVRVSRPFNPDGTEGGPVWPENRRRPSSWTRPGFAIMPDRFVAYVYKNGARRGPYYGGRVIEPLQVTPDPKLRETDLVEFAPGHKIDPRLQWNVNFDGDSGRAFESATKVGMGILVPLEGDDAVTGFERVIVLGVKSSMGSESTARMIGNLIDAHHFTSGIEFLRHGTPTNNLEGQPTSYPLQENAGEISFGVEREPVGAASAADGNMFRRALGLTSSNIFNTIRGQEAQQIEMARAMNRVLWPATLGYYMRYLFEKIPGTPDIFSKEQIAASREYFSRQVLARGTTPGIRVGSVPYGILPVAALGPWQERNFRTVTPEIAANNGVEAGIIGPLRTLFGVWKEAAEGVLRIRPGRDNPDVDVAQVLATYPSAKQFRIRWGVGKDVQLLHTTFLGVDITAHLLGYEIQTSDSLATINRSNWRPKLGYTLFDQETSLYTGEVVGPLPLSEEAPLAANFIDGIRNADIGTLNAGTVPGAPSGENLLYSVLRHSTLMAYLLGYDANIAPLPDWEIFFIPSHAGPPATLAQIVDANPPIDLGTLPGVPAHWAALNQLKVLPTAELERLFTESLDLTSHRLDAWVTALAKRRVDEMRDGSPFPPDDHFGAFGWVENVKPATRPTVNVPGLGDMPTQANSGGFVHAPSMTQASAAAVLRSGHMSVKSENGGEGAGAYAVDLSSRRVRLARRLFEGVRNGQPLGALLGYELERRLHEAEGTPGLDAIRFALRKLYPLVANQSGTDGDEPAESIAARNVVDGARLLLQKNSIPWGTADLPALDTTQYFAVKAEIDRLDEMFDATADLLTAEGVFQLVRGNIDAAVPAINNIAEGVQPPDTVVSRSSRGGIGLSHRVVLVFPSDDGPALPDDTWPANATPRAAAEPVLNAWIGQIIGDPTEVKAELRYVDAEGNTITSTPSGGSAQERVTVSLDELDLHPLDLLAIAQVVAQQNQGSTLDFRIITVALADPDRQPDDPPARFELIYDVAGSRSFLDLMEILNAATRVLTQSRPLRVSDLVTPADADDAVAEAAAVIPDPAAKSFYERAGLVRLLLSGTITVLGDALNSGSGYRAALGQAALFDPLAAFPNPATPDEDLRPDVQRWRTDLQARSTGLPAALTNSQLDTRPGSEIVAAAMVIFKALLGENVLAIPPLVPPRAGELDRSLEARGDLLNGAEDAPDKYLQQIMRTRDKMKRFRKLGLYARTAGVPKPRVDVIQLPHQPGERWLGLPFSTPPEEGRSAMLVVNYASELHAADVTWSGLFIDDWTEIIPNRAEDTGIAFNYEGPRAKAPQTILVAAPSGTGANWVWDELVESVEQAFDLAQIRAVDRDLLGLGQLIPAAVFTANENPDNTVSTVFSSIAQPPPDAEGLEQ